MNEPDMNEGGPTSGGTPRTSLWPIAGAVVVAGLVIAAAIRLPAPSGQRGGAAPGQPAAGEPSPGVPPGEQARVEVSADDDVALGDPKAPVTMIEFSDFECPFCKRFRDQTFSTLKERYIDTGKVRFVYRDLPLTQIHEHAQKAAEAGECADEQGKFWELHDAIFANQQAMTVPDLKKYAADLRLDTGKFNACLDGGKYAEEVKKDVADAEKVGATGTPSFFINGIPVSGAQPTENFVQIIEGELKKTQQ